MKQQKLHKKLGETQRTFTCSKSTMEALEKRCEIRSKLATKTPEFHTFF